MKITKWRYVKLDTCDDIFLFQNMQKLAQSSRNFVIPGVDLVEINTHSFWVRCKQWCPWYFWFYVCCKTCSITKEFWMGVQIMIVTVEHNLLSAKFYICSSSQISHSFPTIPPVWKTCWRHTAICYYRWVTVGESKRTTFSYLKCVWVR